MKKLNKYLIYINDDFQYALNLDVVDRVIPSVYITPLSDVPDIIQGIINLQGQIIPVINMRKILSLQERELNINDQIIIAHTIKRTYALLVDSVKGVYKIPEEEVDTGEKVLHGLNTIEGLTKLENDILLISNLSELLSLDEDEALSKAFEAGERDESDN